MTFLPRILLRVASLGLLLCLAAFLVLPVRLLWLYGWGLIAAGADVVLVEVPGGAILDRHFGVHAAVARHHRARLVGEGLLRRVFLLSARHTTDGIHLNRDGHAVLAQRFTRVLRDDLGIK